MLSEIYAVITRGQLGQLNSDEKRIYVIASRLITEDLDICETRCPLFKSSDVQIVGLWKQKDEKRREPWCVHGQLGADRVRQKLTWTKYIAVNSY